MYLQFVVLKKRGAVSVRFPKAPNLHNKHDLNKPLTGGAFNFLSTILNVIDTQSDTSRDTIIPES